MSVTIDLPDELLRAVQDNANRGGIPVEEYLARAALAAVVSAADRPDGGLEVLRAAAARADTQRALAVLDSMPDAEPDPHDRFPPDLAELRDRMIAEKHATQSAK